VDTSADVMLPPSITPVTQPLADGDSIMDTADDNISTKKTSAAGPFPEHWLRRVQGKLPDFMDTTVDQAADTAPR
jgi:hypothetical protein